MLLNFNIAHENEINVVTVRTIISLLTLRFCTAHRKQSF